MPHTKIFEGCVDDHLLILAQSAEIVARSQDSVVGMHTNNKNKGICNGLIDRMSREYASNIASDGCSHEPLDRLSMVSHGSSQPCGFSSDVPRTRVTQIRKQARFKYLILDAVRAKDNNCGRSQRKIIRLNQIKRQARSQSKQNLSPLVKMIAGSKIERPQVGMLRLSQMKRQARSKGNSTVNDGTKEDNKENVVAKQFVKKDICEGDSNLSVVEGLPVHNFFTGAGQSPVVRWDDDTLKGHQRAARRLRALKTKKLRQQLRTECRRYSTNTKLCAMKMTSSPFLSNSATLQKEKDLISCRQEIPETFAYDEKSRADFGAEKHQESDESPAPTCKSLRHTPNGLQLQNSELPITGLPNYKFQQCDTNLWWMLYMPNIQPNKYHHVVAPQQHRAECVEAKRTLKNKAASISKPYGSAANSGAREEFIPVKRLRLTQLRRELV